jgi:mannose/fructose/N-acetylgalactosamine-specific phosphotransferase system component IIB
MITLIRVDDRLLHGQIVCAWVPFVRANALIIASDEAAGDSLVKEIMASCCYEGLSVAVESIDEVVRHVSSGEDGGSRTILVVGELKDAMRIYDAGMKFDALNIGNIHHGDNGRMLSPSVIINSEDESILDRFEKMGVRIDIRDVPTGVAVAYSRGRR